MLSCMLALTWCYKACNSSVPFECTLAVCGSRCQTALPSSWCQAVVTDHLFLLYRFLLDALHLQYKKNMTALGEKWNPPWTEFNLYWIYATQAEVFEDWHVTDVVSIAANTEQQGREDAGANSVIQNWRPLQHAAAPCNIDNGQLQG